jgi:ATP-dependent DNA ligase
VKALARLPDETVIDGEVVALDEEGRPSFNALQNYGSSAGPVVFFVFDVMVLAGRDVMKEPLSARRALLERRVLAKLKETGEQARASYCTPFVGWTDPYRRMKTTRQIAFIRLPREALC